MHKYCFTCKHSESEAMCADCGDGVESKWCPKTNADRIRAMSDEELATAMCQHSTTCDGCPVVESCHGEHGLPELVAWLRQEVEQ